MELKLVRTTSGKRGTFGVLLDPQGEPLCTTCEDPWNGNKTDISCIPEGRYEVKRYSSPAHPRAFELQNVPGRTKILIHEGNTIEDTQGCILIGQGFGIVKAKPAVINSVVTLNMLISLLPKTFYLTIVNPQGVEG